MTWLGKMKRCVAVAVGALALAVVLATAPGAAAAEPTMVASGCAGSHYGEMIIRGLDDQGGMAARGQVTTGPNGETMIIRTPGTAC